MRLGLALTVIVAHSWPVGGYGVAPGFGDQNLGDWAVAGFFAISGYLITASRLHTRPVAFYWRRFLRIYPAYIAATLVVVVGLGPLAALLMNSRYDWGSGFSYLMNNALVIIRQWGIDGTLVDVPYPITWNGSAWTLFYELLCYLAIGVVVSIVRKRHLTTVLIIALVASSGLTAVIHLFNVGAPEMLSLSARLGSFFIAGAILYQLREVIPIHWIGLVIACGVLVFLASAGLFQVFAGLPIAYLMMWLGIRLPLDKVGTRTDLSYGVYIYAFPLQQIIATVFLRRDVSLIGFIALSVTMSVVMATASWFLIEKPAMSFRDALGRKHPTKLDANDAVLSAPPPNTA